MSDHEVKMIVLSTDDLDESIKFYSDTLGMALKFRDGTHFAALDGGGVTLALATAVDHPRLGELTILNQPITLSRTPAELATATPDRGDHTGQQALGLETDDPHEETADGGTDGPDHQVTHQAVASPAAQHAGHPTGQDPDDDVADEAHSR